MTILAGSGDRPQQGTQGSWSRLHISEQLTKSLSSETVRKIDLLLFGVLFTFVVFYELQNLWPFISDFKLREVLYLYLITRVLTAYRIKVNLGIGLLFLFFLYAGFVAVHTWLAYGSEFAIKGLLRWVNAALIAPIALIIIRNMEEARKFLCLWIVLVVLGAMAGPYQFLGGELDWLVRGYASFRGSVVRFKTILGEPNVGGMVGALVLAFAVIAIRSILAKSILVICSLTMIVFSVSKAALGASMVVVLLAAWNGYLSFKRTAFIVGPSVILGAMIVVLIPEVGKGGVHMIDSSVKAFLGKGEKGAVEDLYSRTITMTSEGIALALEEGDLPVLTLLGGGSFAIAGSAALELGAQRVVLPHNSFAEIFLVGGVVYLVIFLSLIMAVYDRLRKHRNNNLIDAVRVMVICSVGLALIYPVIYAPALGSLFWLAVGVSLSGCLNKNAPRRRAPVTVRV